MSKKQPVVTNITYQIDDEILKMLLEKIAVLSSRVSQLEVNNPPQRYNPPMSTGYTQ